MEAAETAQDTVSAWLRAQSGEPASIAPQTADGWCSARAPMCGRAETMAQPCITVSRQRAYDDATGHHRVTEQRWLQPWGLDDAARPCDAVQPVDMQPLDRLAAEDAKAGGQMRPAMFAEKGCTTTLAAEHRHWLQLIRQQLQVTSVSALIAALEAWVSAHT